MKISATIGRIPSKARLVLILCAGIAVGFCVLFFKMMGSSTPAVVVDDKQNSKSSIPINLDSSKVDKAKPDQAITLPTESEAFREIGRINEKSKDEAVKSGGSFVDVLHLNNEKIIVKKIDDELAKKPVQTGVDDVLATQKESEIQRREALLRKREEILRNNQNIQAQQHTARVSEPLVFDEDAFIEKEVKGQAYKTDGMNAYIKNEGNSKVRMMGDFKNYSDGVPKSNIADTKQTGGYAVGNGNYYSGMGTPGVAKTLQGNLDINGNPIPVASKQTAYQSLVSPTSTIQKTVAPYITTGTMYYAVLEIGINTDELSPVRATVVQEGPLKGAVLVGEPSRNGEKSVITFKSMSVNGKDYAVSVVALDPDTMRTGLADDVDHHTFERYFKLATASIVAGYAEALNGNTTTVNSDGSSQSVKERLPKTSDQIASAIGKVGSVLAPKYEKEFDRAPTITVNGNRDLGIMFMSGVQL